jgi:hypothetical protein
MLLRELNDRLRENRTSQDFKLLDDVEFNEACLADCVRDIASNRRPSINRQRAHSGNFFYVKAGEHVQLNEASLNHWTQSPSLVGGFFENYVKFSTIKLDGPNRIGLTQDRQLQDLQEPPNSRLDQLFRNDAARVELRRLAFDAIKSYLVLDPTKPGHVRVRLSSTEPLSHAEEKGFHAESVEFHGRALHIEQASDGIKAFCGILIELYAGDPRILLIDEPEAFLHPSLAFFLGKTIAAKAQATGKQLFISTHSAHFLMGCIQSGARLNVVRLTYSGGMATARDLPSADLVRFMRNPLLRSVGVLNGLFYDGVVVTEGDTDRAFYNEINERLLAEGRGRGARNCLFLNAQNKQTEQLIVSMLRRLGIPAAGIVDIDIIKEGGSVWTAFLRSGGISQVTISAHSIARSTLNSKFSELGRDMKTEGGLVLLRTEDRAAANDLFDSLDGYGLFTVRIGEVESWLKSLNVRGKGTYWLVEIFERLGENPTSAAYIQPGDNDVWDFVDRVAKWISAPARRGILASTPGAEPNTSGPSRTRQVLTLDTHRGDSALSKVET